MKKTTIILIIITLFSNLTNAQNKYESLWLEVEKKEVSDLPTSALKIVEKIYAKALKENNSAQLIKSLFYKSKFTLQLKEDATFTVIQQLKKHIATSEFPTKNVLENVLANLYWQYFKKNRYTFYNRTKTQQKTNIDDFRTWDLQTLFAEIDLYFKASLKETTKLQATDIYPFAAILQIGKHAKQYRPTLYDFLANNALNFYTTTETSITKPKYQFTLDTPDLLANLKTFSTLDLVSKDSLSPLFNALKIYQKLIQFHKQKNHLHALVAIDLERIHFVNQHGTFADKEAVLLRTLEASKTAYAQHEVSGLYAYEIANIYKNNANYYPLQKHTAHRFKHQEALAICNDVITQFKGSLAAKKCTALQAQIQQPSLSITAEAYIAPHKNSRLLVQYKNVDSLYFTAYKVTQNQLATFYKISHLKGHINFLKVLKKAKQWQHALRNEADYLFHTTEVIAPKLKKGTYLIIASENKHLQKNSIYGTASLQATNLTLIEQPYNEQYNYQVVNRTSGKPIKNARILLSNKQQRRGNRIAKKLITNHNGFASFKSKKSYTNVAISVETATDIATFGKHYVSKNSPNNYYNNTQEDVVIQPFIFTDRSIYRPGQTVYFKTIVIQKQKETSTVLKKKHVTVLLKDTHHQTIQQLEVQLNEFGSVAGEFKLPNNGATGNFKIEVQESTKQDTAFYKSTDFNYGVAHISVEEYKRPTFKTAFKTMTNSFKINDSVTVNGFAKAFSGANITDAKVVYSVYRKVQYPNWYYWYKPTISSEAQEITHGKSSTDDSGNFSIVFKALADKSVSKESNPIFTYAITATVTDINGETRSATTTVKIGYHALLANVSIANKLDKNAKKNTLSIRTENLNGTFVAAKGTLKIYKLKAPKNPLRKRPWSAPDYQDISEEEFRHFFPNDPYTDEEATVTKWPKGPLVYAKNFDTQTTTEVSLKNMKNWVSGEYILILESKDPFGQPVKDEQRFHVFSSKEKEVTDNQLFVINTDKSFYNVDDVVELTVGSASKNLTVTIQVEKNHTIIDTYILALNNNSKSIKIPVNKEDLGGFAIKYHYVNFNYFKSGNLPINVTETRKNISIETLVFRDQLQPGQNETWSFSIQNDTDDKLTAEVLASMYDASLDEFKPHQWNFTPIAPIPTYYSYGQSRANDSFKNTYFRVINHRRNYSPFPKISYTTYNWFGFSLENTWLNKQYLTKIKRKITSNRIDFDGIITGIVVDEQGEALPGVSVRINNTTFGTETDFDGNYTLKIKKGDVLTFSYVGFINQEFSIQSETNLDVQLTTDTNRLDEVVVTGYGTSKKESFTGSSFRLNGEVAGLSITDEDPSQIRIKGISNISGAKQPLYIVDGVFVNQLNLKESDIAKITVLKGMEATAIYGEKALNGAIIISTKKAIAQELLQVKARTSFNETAFFFPQLKTDKNGHVHFTFTMPEALTQWKLQLLAHTTNLKSATKTLTTVTQKELMVVPNAPRFLREKDSLTLNAKITNLTKKPLSGFATLILTDALSGKEINTELKNLDSHKSFTVDKDGNTNVSWSLSIPETIQAVQYKIVAKAGTFSDGEQNVLPVLSNRMLVTESLPLWIRSNATKTFTLDKLKNNTSLTLKNHKLTLEMTSNPAWYAIQSLPYLMEYPYECAEQTFSKYYANTLASFVANSNPKIQEVFRAWKTSDALLSHLEKNKELKSLIIEETPWLRDAESETAQKKRIALLFDLNTMKNNQEIAIAKLKDMQMHSGGFAWFKGGRYESNFISQHIATGFGYLQKLGVTNFDTSTQKMIEKTINYLDNEFLEEYQNLLQRAATIKATAKTKAEGEKKYTDYLTQNNLSYFTIQYLYMRSFYPSISIHDKLQEAVSYYRNQTIQYWTAFNLYAKGQIALSLYRANKASIAKNILKSLKENAIVSDELGMYWKANTAGYYYYQAPIETQALLIAAFSEIENDTKTIDYLKVWLLQNKQTNQWKTTKATTEAVYALLLNGSDWISNTEMADISVGDTIIAPSTLENVKVEAGTGYFKTSWNANDITPKMAKVTINKKGNEIIWGGLYWQYFEDLDKITAATTPLKIHKQLFLKVTTDNGKELQAISKNTALKVGDLLTVRIELKSDRDMEFIHLKDMRASGVEPLNVLSKYKWQDGLGYYESTKDAATHFFFDRLPKGVYVFEYDLRVNNAGNFSNGITTIQSMYAPEFSSHSKGIRIKTLQN